ncbi:MAG: HAD family phosphatase [Paraclostridium bifermentans]|uniref:HAD family hydrolase n=1 Tax=Paraclostridium bifermentans TaxID=1490 RepID=UPI001D42B3AE|nr:HAD family hydrolase [Paraclostridium bifermentans]MBS6509004.1 HAD family phosphatase [Paraclostridium bifermentans]MDU3803816.1 HAD family hydrolase [Paraclostridium bifermentans]
MVKLIATDMDGTLLNGNHEIPKDFKDTINALKEKDVMFAISTGRNYLDISYKFDDYKDELLFICENGTGIYYKDECIYSKFLEKDTIKQLVELGREVDNAYPMLCGTKGLYLEDEEALEQLNVLFPMNVPVTKVDSLLDVEDGIFKVNMFDLTDAETNSYKIFKNANIDGVTLTPSGKYWLDMSSFGTNKGLAIKKVQDMFDIDYKETMVFGDHLNDLEMMKSAYYSYAMKNGHDDVKEIANFETKYTNEECGVTKTIKEEVLQAKELA